MKPMDGRASMTFSSSTTRSRWIGSGSTGCCGPKGMTVRAIKIYLVAPVVAGGVVAQGAAAAAAGAAALLAQGGLAVANGNLMAVL